MFILKVTSHIHFDLFYFTSYLYLSFTHDLLSYDHVYTKSSFASVNFRACLSRI